MNNEDAPHPPPLLHWAALSAFKPAGREAAAGRASGVTQRKGGGLGRDSDPTLLCISDGEVSGEAGQDPPSLQTLTDSQRQRKKQLLPRDSARQPT